MARYWTAEQIPDQSGRTAILTGANSGIGFYAAQELARHGARVILACRDKAKGAEAADRIRSSVPDAKVEVAGLDLSSLASVRLFAGDWLVRGVPLDLLINNAGTMALPARKLTQDGFEMQFGTNHLGHFALTGLLFPSLVAASKESAQTPRVVTVSSLAHRRGKIDFSDLMAEKSYDPWGAYSESKLANLMFALNLQRRITSAGLRMESISVHPGWTATNIFANTEQPGKAPLYTRMAKFFFPLMAQPGAMGALPTLYAATEGAAKGGHYYGPGGIAELRGYPVERKPRPSAEDQQVAAKLWQVSEELTGVNYAGL